MDRKKKKQNMTDFLTLATMGLMAGDKFGHQDPKKIICKECGKEKAPSTTYPEVCGGCLWKVV